MEERHGESETMDYEIHEPHDRMGTIVLDSQKWNDLRRETTTVHIGEEKTTRSGESVNICAERRLTGNNQEYQSNKEEPAKYRDRKLDSRTTANKTKDTTKENYKHDNALETRG